MPERPNLNSHPPNSWAAHAGEPSFRASPSPGAITQIALPLLAWLDDWLVSWGTVTLLRPGLGITATHVIEALLKGWNIEIPASSNPFTRAAPFHLLMLQNGPNPGTGHLWRAYRLITCPGTDITAVLLAPYSENWTDAPKIGPKVTFHPPDVGSRVTAFGYPRTRTWIESEQGAEGITLAYEAQGHTAVGSVEEIHMGGRDRGLLSFPCFRTSAQFDPGMSGGPVFDEDGKLCGIVSCGTEGVPLLNYASLLWPTGVVELDVSAEGSDPHKRTICQMAAEGAIDISGCEGIMGRAGEVIHWRSTAEPPEVL